MSSLRTCASCASTQDLKHCARCRTISYCSVACQRAHWKQHKRSCHFQVTKASTAAVTSEQDALSLLRKTSDPGTKAYATTQSPTGSAAKLLNIHESRLAIFSNLPAPALLRAQAVCRSWYLTITLETTLQQRLFLAPGPGELVLAARKGETSYSGIQPRNEGQRGAAKMEKRSFEAGRYLVTTSDGETKELSPSETEKAGLQIILNPFFTSLWPQDPTNMTLLPRVILPTSCSRAASWRRMHVTSPPATIVGLNMWYTKSNGKGSQLCIDTGNVPSGVTLGHIADMLAAQPTKLTYHWMQVNGQAWWKRSADAVVAPKDRDVGNNDARPGVYVNPSNGIAFPGFM